MPVQLRNAMIHPCMYLQTLVRVAGEVALKTVNIEREKQKFGPIFAFFQFKIFSSHVFEG